jgi:hypothetical protein
MRMKTLMTLLTVALATSPACKRDTDGCEAVGDCALMTNDCCGAPCDPSTSDFSAVNKDRMADFRQDSCEVVDGCEDRGCETPTPTRFLATCRDERCVVEDTGSLPLTACAADEDCVLRLGLGCCEPCEGNDAHLTSVRADGLEDLAALTCAAGQRCGGCSPEYPPGATAVCLDGRCNVSR